MRPSRKPSKAFVFTRRAPELPDDLGTLPNLSELFDVRDVTIADGRVEGLQTRGRTYGSVRIERAVLERVSLPECECGSIAMKDVRLVNCDLANVAARGVSLVRVEFINCRMTGFRAVESDCRDLLVSGGDLKYCQFRQSKFTGAQFDSSNFEEADLQESDLSGSVFTNWNLRNADLLNTKLMNTDLRGSTIEGMTVSTESLRGAVVDPSQAMVFALLLGLRIE